MMIGMYIVHILFCRRGSHLFSDSDIEDIRPAPSGGRTPNPSSKVNLVKEHVDEVMGIMRTNITKTIERGDKMEAIVDKTGAPDDPCAPS